MNIYVRDLASGKGCWVEDIEEIEEIDDVWLLIRTCVPPNAEEFEIVDHEGFKSVDASQCGVAEAHALARLINQHGAAYAMWADYVGLYYANEEDFKDIYAGSWQDSDNMSGKANWAWDYLGEHISDPIPSWLIHAVDWDRAADELSMLGDAYLLLESSSKCHVFYAQ